MNKKAIILSGHFNPLHKGYIEYFSNAKALAYELSVIVNSDYQKGFKGD
jgi:cytidyltransferase-like protein